MTTRRHPTDRAHLGNGALMKYLQTIDELGFLVGRQGAQTLSEPARALLTALHQVLAGGHLDVDSISVTKGKKHGIDRRLVKKLDKLALGAIDEANSVSEVRWG